MALDNKPVGPVSFLWTKILLGFAVVVAALGAMSGYGIAWGFCAFLAIGAVICYFVERPKRPKAS